MELEDSFLVLFGFFFKMSFFFFYRRIALKKSYLVHLVEFMFVLRNKSNYLLKHFITMCSRKPLSAGI